MSNQKVRNAGIIAAILAIVIIIVAYALVGSVDLVFKKGGIESYRIEDAGIFSELTIPEDGTVYVYTTDGGEIQFGDTMEFRAEIAKVVFMNFINFEWQEHDNYIELHAK